MLQYGLVFLAVEGTGGVHHYPARLKRQKGGIYQIPLGGGNVGYLLWIPVFEGIRILAYRAFTATGGIEQHGIHGFILVLAEYPGIEVGQGGIADPHSL